MIKTKIKRREKVRREHQNIDFFTKSCWLQCRRRNYFQKLSVSQSLSHNITLFNQSWVWSSRKYGVFINNLVILLSETTLCFCCMSGCFSLIWNLQSNKNQVTERWVLLIYLTQLFYLSIIKMKVILIISIIHYTIYSTFEHFIFEVITIVVRGLCIQWRET